MYKLACSRTVYVCTNYYLKHCIPKPKEIKSIYVHIEHTLKTGLQCHIGNTITNRFIEAVLCTVTCVDCTESCW